MKGRKKAETAKRRAVLWVKEGPKGEGRDNSKGEESREEKQQQVGEKDH